MNEIEQKEIEEMAKEIDGTFSYAKKWYPDKYEPFELNVYPDDIARHLVEQGYRNCKNKIVLDKEVFNKNYVLIDELLLKQGLVETLTKVASAQEKKIKLLEEELAQTHKETAKEIIDKVDDMIGGKLIAQALREIYEVE